MKIKTLLTTLALAAAVTVSGFCFAAPRNTLPTSIEDNAVVFISGINNNTDVSYQDFIKTVATAKRDNFVPEQYLTKQKKVRDQFGQCQNITYYKTEKVNNEKHIYYIGNYEKQNAIIDIKYNDNNKILKYKLTPVPDGFVPAAK